MSEAEVKPPFLSIDFGDQGGRFVWATSQEALDWINLMRQEWRWLGTLGQSPIDQAANLIATRFNDAFNHAQQAQSYINQGQSENAVGHIANAKKEMAEAQNSLYEKGLTVKKTSKGLVLIKI